MTAQENLFQMLADGAPVMIWIADTEKLCYYFNRPWLDFTGSTLEQEYGNGWARGVHPDDYQRCLDIYISHFDQRKSFSMQYRLRRHDGVYRWILDNGKPYFGQDQNFLGYIGSCTDITEMHESEQELRIAATAFETQEGITVTDARGIILRTNSAFTKITGYEENEVVGKTPALLKSGRQDEHFYRQMWVRLLTDGSWQGEIWNKRKNGEIYPEWLSISAVIDPVTGKISNYVGTFSDISFNKETERQIRHLAYYDELTGLPNRRLFFDHLRQALRVSERTGSYGALFFIDLDNFKQINDTQGHNVGDRLLTDTARRLIESVLEEDRVGRMGGDEYVILLENIGQDSASAIAAAEEAAKRIGRIVGQPYRIGDIDLRITASTGIILFKGSQVSAEELLKYADSAMHLAKNAGRNTIRFFDAGLQAELEKRFELERALQRALDENEFRLYYQAQITGGKITGVEALVRWQRDSKSIISPGEFIPIAEDTGMIIGIGDWVLKSACAQIKDWETHPAAKFLTVSVNLSTRQLYNVDLIPSIEKILASSGIAPGLLKIEITESIMMKNMTKAASLLLELRNLGLRISIDDFGTGYSSLAYLANLPIDQIKIDQRFTDQMLKVPSSAIIVKAIIGLANDLGIEVIAEGVETDQQRAFLHEHGCHVFQGYLFGQPMPADEIRTSPLLH